jgi:fructose-specific phosphotransferase system component IIB
MSDAISEGDEVWVSPDVSVEGDEFLEALNSVDGMILQVRRVQQELMDLNTGLEREDAIRLIYGKNPDLTLGEVEETFDALDAIAEADEFDLGERLLSMKTDLNLQEAAEVISEIEKLAEKYATEDN